MAGEIFQIYIVQIIRKCTCETFFPSLRDLILDHILEHSLPLPRPIIFSREKRKALPYFWEDETLLYLYISYHF